MMLSLRPGAQPCRNVVTGRAPQDTCFAAHSRSDDASTERNLLVKLVDRMRTFGAAEPHSDPRPSSPQA